MMLTSAINAVIYGTEGSYAQRYANEKGIQFVAI